MLHQDLFLLVQLDHDSEERIYSLIEAAVRFQIFPALSLSGLDELSNLNFKTKYINISIVNLLNWQQNKAWLIFLYRLEISIKSKKQSRIKIQVLHGQNFELIHHL